MWATKPLILRQRTAAKDRAWRTYSPVSPAAGAYGAAALRRIGLPVASLNRWNPPFSGRAAVDFLFLFEIGPADSMEEPPNGNAINGKMRTDERHKGPKIPCTEPSIIIRLKLKPIKEV
jgi:hypothetical protein